MLLRVPGRFSSSPGAVAHLCQPFVIVQEGSWGRAILSCQSPSCTFCDAPVAVRATEIHSPSELFFTIDKGHAERTTEVNPLPFHDCSDQPRSSFRTTIRADSSPDPIGWEPKFLRFSG